ncbi:peptidoglycan-binding protein [Bacillus sp. JCM 19034]|uniref:peptidoglycan-binding protein n=1 Tax=Bacillus sp. JCM 19034 TaxID=1481928 RepID=UPI00078175E6|nr:peptidoglycan-binding protein [Bacillus sp. JCM 19034]
MSVFAGYRITSQFGWRTHPIRGGRQWHTGIDLVKAHQAPIEAFTEGEVLFAGMGQRGSGFGGYGNVVFIRDKNNRGQVYAHLDSIAVKVGQQVRRGQVIGRQGATGEVTTSHLHYEVRKKAESSTPYGWRADRVNNCLDPTEYLQRFYNTTQNIDRLLTPNRLNTGPAVRKIQNQLLAVGESLPRYGADGTFGPETERAVRSFQSRRNITVDGIVGQETRAELARILPIYRRLILLKRPYMSGQDVRAVQRVVGVADDSIYGHLTANAVRRYQQSYQLAVDGIVGPRTWGHMF